MSRFAAAFRNWFTSHNGYRLRGPQPADRLSLRQLAETANIPSPLLTSYYHGKRPITFEGLTKLLPAIERHSSRTEAVSLHIAYLLDEVVAEYRADLSIATAEPRIAADAIARRAKHWEETARTNPDFEAMWAGLSYFMEGTEETVHALEAVLAGDPGSHLYDSTGAAGMLNEDPAPYGTSASL
jgi:AcrR family transcriptional regulator